MNGSQGFGDEGIFTENPKSGSGSGSKSLIAPIDFRTPPPSVRHHFIIFVSLLAAPSFS